MTTIIITTAIRDHIRPPRRMKSGSVVPIRIHTPDPDYLLQNLTGTDRQSNAGHYITSLADVIIIIITIKIIIISVIITTLH